MKLTLHNLSFERNQQILFSDINCTLHAGEILQVRGANGSGKSTLLRMLAGYIEAPTNTILWADKCISLQQDQYQQQLHYVGHQNGIKPYLTVRENLQFTAALAAKAVTHQQIYEALQQIGIENLISTQAQHLSAGQLRRLSLTKLVLNPQPLWILDEPLTALDSDAQQIILDLLSKHLDNSGMAVVATHHDFSLMREMKIIQLR